MKIGFDNEKYLKMQSEHIRDRINQFDNKLYLEFGGKLFDDFHASRVLPGFAPDAKLRMLMQLSDQAEIVMAISASDIEKNKIRGDLGITYDSDVLRLIDEFRGRGLYVGSVVITQYSGQHSADAFKKRLQKLGIPVYIHYTIPGYPHNVPLIVSDEGYGKNEYIETTRPLVVVTAPGPGSGKMATCLSQLYHEHKRGVNAGYAKYETFPIWNLPLKHPLTRLNLRRDDIARNRHGILLRHPILRPTQQHIAALPPLNPPQETSIFGKKRQIHIIFAAKPQQKRRHQHISKTENMPDGMMHRQLRYLLTLLLHHQRLPLLMQIAALGSDIKRILQFAHGKLLGFFTSFWENRIRYQE